MTVNGITYSHDVSGNQSLAQVLTTLASGIDAATGYTAAVDGNMIVVTKVAGGALTVTGSVPLSRALTVSFDTASVTVDGRTVSYSNVESAKNIVVNATSGADTIVLDQSGSTYRVMSTNGTFSTVTLGSGLDSLTINGGYGNDTISIDSGISAFTPGLKLDGGEGTDTLNLGATNFSTLAYGTNNENVTGTGTVDNYVFDARTSIANRVTVTRPSAGYLTITDVTDIGTTSVTVRDPLKSLTINTGYNAPYTTTEYVHLNSIGNLNANVTINGGSLNKNLDGSDSVVIDGDLILTGHKLTITAETIEVKDNVTVSTSDAAGTAGDITFNGYHISLDSGSELLAVGQTETKSGDIALLAVDENALFTPFVNVDISDVDVTIGTNAVVTGRDVTLLATADSRKLLAADEWYVDYPVNILGSVIEGLSQILGAVSYAQADSSIDIQLGSAITARNFIAHSSSMVTVSASAITPIAVGIAITDASVTVDGTIITSGDATFRSTTDQTMNVVSDTTGLKGIAPGSGGERHQLQRQHHCQRQCQPDDRRRSLCPVGRYGPHPRARALHGGRRRFRGRSHRPVGGIRPHQRLSGRHGRGRRKR